MKTEIPSHARKSIAVSVLTAAVLLAGCSGSPKSHGVPVPAARGVPQVTITAGPEYSRVHWFGIMPVTCIPQIAVWVEAPDGTFAGTLFVTKKAAAGSWAGGKNIERPEALPVFFRRSGMQPGTGTSDAASSATPKIKDSSAYYGTSASRLADGRYIVYAEVNSSFDFNDAFPEKRNDVNGQPSILYMGELVVGDSSSKAVLVPTGRSGNEGSEDLIVRNLDGLTTALNMLDSISVSIQGKAGD